MDDKSAHIENIHFVNWVEERTLRRDDWLQIKPLK